MIHSLVTFTVDLDIDADHFIHLPPLDMSAWLYAYSISNKISCTGSYNAEYVLFYVNKIQFAIFKSLKDG